MTKAYKQNSDWRANDIVQVTTRKRKAFKYFKYDISVQHDENMLYRPHLVE
jgi:hypothetical protein